MIISILGLKRIHHTFYSFNNIDRLLKLLNSLFDIDIAIDIAKLCCLFWPNMQEQANQKRERKEYGNANYLEKRKETFRCNIQGTTVNNFYYVNECFSVPLDYNTVLLWFPGRLEVKLVKNTMSENLAVWRIQDFWRLHVQNKQWRIKANISSISEVSTRITYILL